MNPRQRGNDVGPTGRTVSENLAQARRAQSLSLAQVSQALSAAGRKISVSGLSKIENGERRVDVDDLMALAYVLDISPLGLLLPKGAPDDVVDVTGTRGAIALLWEWMTAEFSPQVSGRRGIAARSLPEWLTIGSEIEMAHRPDFLALEFFWPEKGDVRLVVSHLYNERGREALEALRDRDE